MSYPGRPPDCVCRVIYEAAVEALKPWPGAVVESIQCGACRDQYDAEVQPRIDAARRARGERGT